VSALGFGWFLDSLETSIIGSVLGILRELWKFSPLQGSLTVSVWLIGIMVGAVGQAAVEPPEVSFLRTNGA
jgi:MFS family permease